MDHIFLAIQQRLKSKVPSVKWIDYDYGQLENYEMRPSVLFPAALVDIEIQQATDRGMLSQECKCLITIRLAFDQLPQTNSKVPKPIQDRAMSVFNVMREVYYALHGYGSPTFSKILRRSVTTERRRDDAYKVIVMQFETMYSESMLDQRQLIQLQPKII